MSSSRSLHRPAAIITSYAHDDLGRLYEITDNMPATAKVTEIDYDQDTGAMVKVTLPNGTVTTLEYDDLGRLTALVNAKGDGPGEAIITSYAYHYDNDAIHGGMGLVDRITATQGAAWTKQQLRRVSPALGGAAAGSPSTPTTPTSA